jgi:hypothetical protein
MKRRRVASVVTVLAGVGYIATAALHATGYDSVTGLAEQGPDELRALMPALWLIFSVDLVVLGLIILVIAWRPLGAGKIILAIAALYPLAAAALQVHFLGFIPPTAILLGVAGLALAAAVTTPRYQPG